MKNEDKALLGERTKSAGEGSAAKEQKSRGALFRLAGKTGRGLRRAWIWYRGQWVGRPWWRKIITLLLTLVALVVVWCICVMLNLFWLFGKSPSAYDIMHPNNPEASELYSSDGKLLCRVFDENRSSVPYDSIAPVFFQTLISTEDERFYEHHGVDFQALLAAGKDAATGRARGASTLTQQLVKNMFRIRTQYSAGLLGHIPGLSILIKKTKEMVIAVELEMLNDKEDILMMYANTVDFGSNAYGIKTAAKTYFNTTPSKLRAEQCAVLVGLLKATSTYNPRLNPEASRERRDVVLDNLCQHRHITRDECDSLRALPLRLNFTRETAYDGHALYFRDAVIDYLREHCPDLDPYNDGLRIYTTLDSRMQQMAEQAVTEHMRSLQQSFRNHWSAQGEPWRDEKGQVIPGFIEDLAKRTSAYKALRLRFPDEPDSVRHYLEQPHRVRLFDYQGGHYEQMSTLDSLRYMVQFLHTGLVALEPQTGEVRAYVGDVDYRTWNYDKVQAMRQPGSTFKLFVYSTAMQQGYDPTYTVSDTPFSMQVRDERTGEMKMWAPHNASGRCSGRMMPLRTAFAQSINTVAVRLGQAVTITKVAQTAHDMGIRSPLHEVPSLPLGSSDVCLLEMASAYGTVAAGGEHVDPVLVTRIEDRSGTVLWRADPERSRALNYRAAFYMQKLLYASAHDGGGTSLSLSAAKYLGALSGRLDYGGKTGTTNNHSDGWFMCVTPSLVCGAWVGGEYRSIHFRSGSLGQGSRMALPEVGLFMHSVMTDPQLRERYLRRYDQQEDIDADTYEVQPWQQAADSDTLTPSPGADSTALPAREPEQEEDYGDEFFEG